MEKLDDADKIFEIIDDGSGRYDMAYAKDVKAAETADVDAKPEEKHKKKKKNKDKEETSLKSEIISWVTMIVVAFILAVVIDRFIIVNATVPTGSMENTIMTGSRMIGFRFSYWFSEPKRGDIVVFKNPLDERENYVKRIIGLPGEKVYIEDAKIYIQKTPGGPMELLEENYLKEEWVQHTGVYEFDIPEKCYLMLGDNRNHSADARVWREYVESHNSQSVDDKWDEDIIYVRRNKILGKAILTYWPLDNIKILN